MIKLSIWMSWSRSMICSDEHSAVTNSNEPGSLSMYYKGVVAGTFGWPTKFGEKLSLLALNSCYKQRWAHSLIVLGFYLYNSACYCWIIVWLKWPLKFAFSIFILSHCVFVFMKWGWIKMGVKFNVNIFIFTE